MAAPTRTSKRSILRRVIQLKTFKRNAVILTVVLFVCVAAYLNWSYNRTPGDDTEVAADPPFEEMLQASPIPRPPVAADVQDTPEHAPEAGLFYRGGQEAQAAISDYFAITRINRRQSRDAAAETLATVSGVEGASQDVVDAALAKITNLAMTTAAEAQLESLIMAKGFADCVVFISDDGIMVTVPAPLEGLSMAAVAQITNVIVTETDFRAVDLQIIEVK